MGDQHGKKYNDIDIVNSKRVLNDIDNVGRLVWL